MNGGETFRLVGVADRHTWVVLSDPSQDANHVLIVSFTSYTHGIGMDDSCVVETCEFALLTNRSCLYYADVREATSAMLQTIQKAGRLQWRVAVPGVLLQRIRDGAGASGECKKKYKDLLTTQGLIAPAH